MVTVYKPVLWLEYIQPALWLQYIQPVLWLQYIQPALWLQYIRLDVLFRNRISFREDFTVNLQHLVLKSVWIQN